MRIGRLFCKLVIAFAIFLCFTVSSYAQPGQGGMPGEEQMIEYQMNTFRERLQLTEQQTVQLKPMIQEYVKDMGVLRQKSGGDGQAMFQNMRQLRDDLDKKLNKILSSDQQKALFQLREEQAERWRNRGGGR